MADNVERGFENWKVSGLRAFLLARDVPVCDQAKPIQNCYLAVFLGLQAKKSLDEYMLRTLVKLLTGKAYARWRYDSFT